MMVIKQISIDKLKNICPELNEEFFENLLTEVPQFGKKCNNYYLINNSLTIQNPYNLYYIDIYNIFVQLSRTKCSLLQLTKNKKNE